MEVLIVLGSIIGIGSFVMIAITFALGVWISLRRRGLIGTSRVQATEQMHRPRPDQTEYLLDF